MEKLEKRYKKLKKILEEEFNEVNFNKLLLNKNGYEGTIEIPCEFTLYCVIDNTECYLAFESIDFVNYYTTDDIKELCDKIENISNEINY